MTKELIIKSIQEQKEQYSKVGIRFDKQLITVVYQILYSFFIDDKKFVLLNAPTGSGKSIISFMVSKCIVSILKNTENYNDESVFSYYLTSSKVLQDQIDRDIKRFEFDDMFLLKGSANYECTYEADKVRTDSNMSDDFKKEKLKSCTYTNRPCVGLKSELLANSPFSKCYDNCPYKSARLDASISHISVMNYHYFINVFRSKFNPFFEQRYLTICDEAHKLASIVDSMFSYDITKWTLNQILGIIEKLKENRISIKKSTDEIINKADLLTHFFEKEFSDAHKNTSTRESFIVYLKEYITLITESFDFFDKVQKDIAGDENSRHIFITVSNLLERLKGIVDSFEHILDLCENRPNDLYIESKEVKQYEESKLLKHIIKDLDETKSLQTNFVDKCNKVLFMSATMGNMEEFATIFGLTNYQIFNLPNSFDYTNSPINVCRSGYLTQKFIKENLFKVIKDTIYIVTNNHPNEKGIIHTHTFNINNEFKKILYYDYSDISNRFLFYDNYEEKENNLRLISNSDKPYILIGPSLTEGLDLKDDIGRFNILVKVPYPALTDYARRKMERFPFWYDRNTKEEIVQSIGRTNRSKNDYSTVYLMDSQFEKVIYDVNDEISSRLKYLSNI